MSAIPPVITEQQHAQYEQEGYAPTRLRSIRHKGKCYDEIKYSKSISEKSNEKVNGLANGIFSSLFCCLNPRQGHVHKGYLLNKELTEKQKQEDYEKLGFDYNDNASIQSYVRANQSRVVKVLDHAYLPFHRPTGFSCMVFLPYQNLNQAKILDMWDIKTGNALNTARLHDIAANYCTKYRGVSLGNKIARVYHSSMTPLLIAQQGDLYS